MGNKFRHYVSLVLSNRPVFMLVLSWSLGQILAIILASISGDSFFTLMRMAVSTRVSIVGLFAMSYLPFLFSAFAVYICKPKLLYLIVFLKALLFVFCSLSCVAVFPSAAWLVRILLLFSDSLLLPVLCWFSIRHISGYGNLKNDFSLCTAFFILAASLDYCVVSPFLVMLIDN